MLLYNLNLHKCRSTVKIDKKISTKFSFLFHRSIHAFKLISVARLIKAPNRMSFSLDETMLRLGLLDVSKRLVAPTTFQLGGNLIHLDPISPSQVAKGIIFTALSLSLDNFKKFNLSGKSTEVFPNSPIKNSAIFKDLLLTHLSSSGLDYSKEFVEIVKTSSTSYSPVLGAATHTITEIPLTFDFYLLL